VGERTASAGLVTVQSVVLNPGRADSGVRLDHGVSESQVFRRDFVEIHFLLVFRADGRIEVRLFQIAGDESSPASAGLRKRHEDVVNRPFADDLAQKVDEIQRFQIVYAQFRTFQSVTLPALYTEFAVWLDCPQDIFRSDELKASRSPERCGDAGW
jgi:hypothetical protein